MIITFKNSVDDEEKLRHKFISFGMTGQNIFIVENYTRKDHAADEIRHKEFLEILWKCVEQADSNHKRRHYIRQNSGRCTLL